MPKDEADVTARIADALERMADSMASLEALFIEREKKFAAKSFDKPRGSFGDRGPRRDFGDKPRSFGPKRDFGDKPFKKRDDDSGNDNFDEFKKRGPRTTFRDFDAPKNFKGKKPFGDKKPGGAFKGKKKF